MCTPFKCSLSFFITGFLGQNRGYFTPPFCWWSITGHLVLSLGSLCLPLHLDLSASEARPGRPVRQSAADSSQSPSAEPRNQQGAQVARGEGGSSQLSPVRRRPFRVREPGRHAPAGDKRPHTPPKPEEAERRPPSRVSFSHHAGLLSFSVTHGGSLSRGLLVGPSTQCLGKGLSEAPTFSACLQARLGSALPERTFQTGSSTAI